MQFATVKVGGRELIFPNDTVVVAGFSFARPVTTAAALLQGFHLSHSDGDYELQDVRVELTARIAPGQSAGSVEAHFTLRDAQQSPLQSGPIVAEILILVVGT
jgi:hypothetical protein